MIPVVTMIAGPNGSGKSTLTNELRKRGIEFGEYLNADDIAKSLTGSSIDFGAQAQAQVRQRREAALAERRSHCFETVMSHPSHIEYMRTARAAGFETRLFFVATEDPAINEGRVVNRVLHGGHDVPRDRIATGYRRCLDNLPAAVDACDYCLIFDNSSADDPLRFIALMALGIIAVPDPKLENVPSIPLWWEQTLIALASAHTSSWKLK